MSLLGQAGMECSPRRAGMLLRNVCTVHAAQSAANGNCDLAGSALLAARHSLPQPAWGQRLNIVALLASHREA